MLTTPSLLHWSFNHDNHLQTPGFAEQLLGHLRSLPPQIDQVPVIYTVLPNFWRGYRSKNEQGNFDLSIGEISFAKQQDEIGYWHYSVQSTNTTSGEDMQLSFRCADDALRTLHDNWQIRIKNHAGDGYQQFISQGHLKQDDESGQAVILTVNGVDLPIGQIPIGVPITCNWALFETIPLVSHQLQQVGDVISMTLLEDLEKLRPNTHLGYLEDWEQHVDPDGDRVLHLRGYYLHGQGLPPSYWWLDQQQRVVIVSSIFQTWVLRGYHA